MAVMGYGQGVRVFLSADLSGSTQFESRFPATDRREAGSKENGGAYQLDWLTVFNRFYYEVFARVRKHLKEEVNKDANAPITQIYFWKLAGDEVLLHSSKIESPQSVV